MRHRALGVLLASAGRLARAELGVETRLIASVQELGVETRLIASVQELGVLFISLSPHLSAPCTPLPAPQSPILPRW